MFAIRASPLRAAESAIGNKGDLVPRGDMNTQVGDELVTMLKWLGGLLLVMLVMAALIYPMFAPRAGGSPKPSCLGPMHKIARGMLAYASDNDDRLPPLHTTAQPAPEGQSWPETIQAYVPESRPGGKYDGFYACVSSARDRMSFSLNRDAAGRKTDELIVSPQTAKRDVFQEHATILIFETVNNSPTNNNLNGNSISYPSGGSLPVTGTLVAWPTASRSAYVNWPNWARPNHGMETGAIYADGHARYLNVCAGEANGYLQPAVPTEPNSRK